MSNMSKAEPLILCPDCKREMRLFGTEAESDVRDLYTFECPGCESEAFLSQRPIRHKPTETPTSRAGGNGFGV